jgi:MFS family permease
MRGNLLVFTLSDLLRQLSMFITFPFFSLYVRALGGSVVDIGIANSLRPVLGLFLYPVAGYLSDNYSRVKIIAYTGFLGAALWLFFIFAPDWRWIALGNLLLGLLTFYFPAANSLMAESLPDDKRALGYSLWQAIPLAAGIFSPLAGGYLISLWGVKAAMRALYGLTLIVTVFISAMSLRFLQETPRETPDTSLKIAEIIVSSYRGIYEVMRWMPRNLKAFAVMLTLGFFFNSMVSSYWVVYVVDVMMLTEVQWGLVQFVASAATVVFLVPAGYIVDRVGSKRVLTYALGLSAVPIMLFPYLSSFSSVIALFVALTLANSLLMVGAPSYMAEATPPDKRGRIMSALGVGWLLINTRGGGVGGPGMGALLTIPTIVGSLLGGLVYSYRPELLWLSYGSSLILNIIICWIFLD